MSYRTIKKLLGETSLERKCRFLFGGGLLILITGSFYIYSSVTETLVYSANQKTADALIAAIMGEMHYKAWESDKKMDEKIESVYVDSMTDEIKSYSWSIVAANYQNAGAHRRPTGDTGYEALELLKSGPSVFIDEDRKNNYYHYYRRIDAAESCLNCHYHGNTEANVAKILPNDMIGMVKVSIPLDSTNEVLDKNNAYLISMAIITAFLAMVAAYVIVRYVIVKPILHLKDVSDEIARGNLDLRADIRTGDEFEELSHAFNRMLRHLVTVQEELREVNSEMDNRVDDLAHVNLELHEMNKLKDEFLATMSHELRTPLNSILGFSDVLGGATNLDEKQVRFVNNIKTSGHQLLLMINDLLDLAKIESGKMDLKLVDFKLENLISSLVDAMQMMATKRNIEVTYSVESIMPTIHQDSGKINQILSNLLSNAIKFTPEGGRVRVRAYLENEGMFKVVVEDTGIGIPLEDQETIFEKFRQGRTNEGERDAMTREYGGTGLGLSIVKELAILLGGTVDLESEFGKGSTFTVHLPVHLKQRAHRKLEDFDDPLKDFEREQNRARVTNLIRESKGDSVTE